MARLLLAVVACVIVTGCSRPGTEYERSGQPTLKLEVRQASLENVPGWQAVPEEWWDSAEHLPFKSVSPEVDLSNDDVAGTSVGFDNLGHCQIVIRLTETARTRFAKLSARLATRADNVQQRYAQRRHLLFLVNGRIIGAPMVTAAIPDGVIHLSGAFTEREARHVAAGIVGPRSE